MPVVVLPGRPPVLGFNARELAAAIDVAVGRTTDSPEVVFESLDRVLAATLAAAAQLDHAALDFKMSNRDRNLRELIYDIFCKALIWSQADDPGGDAPQEQRAQSPQDARPARPSEGSQKRDAVRYPDGDALVKFGQAARVVLHSRFSPDRHVDYDRILGTPDGSMTLGDTMAWLASHAAFHLRQLYWLMEHDLHIRPRERLDLEALPGVALPQDLW